MRMCVAVGTPSVRRVRLAIVVALVVGGSGCQLAGLALDRPRRVYATSSPAVCRPGGLSGDPAERSPAALVAASTCARSGDFVAGSEFYAGGRAIRFDTLYARYDEEQADPVQAALVLVSCFGSGRCHSTEGQRYEIALPFSYGATASRYHIAASLDQAALARAVGVLGLPADVEQAFLNATDAARTSIVATVDRWSAPYKAVFVEPITKVRARWSRDRKALAELHDRWRALRQELDEVMLDKRLTHDHLERLQRLREEHMQACRELEHAPSLRECLHGPIAQPATEYLVRGAIALRDRMTAEVEHHLLSSGPDGSDVRYHMNAAVEVTLHVAQQRHRDYLAARERGVNPELLARKFGASPPPDFDDFGNEVGLVPPQPADYEAEILGIGGSIHTDAGTVRRVTRSGDATTLAFESETESHTEYVNCRESNRVDRVTADGRIVYRQVCDEDRLKSRYQLPQIRLTTHDAERVRGGDTVGVVYDTKTRRGRILGIKRGKTLVQLGPFSP